MTQTIVMDRVATRDSAVVSRRLTLPWIPLALSIAVGTVCIVLAYAMARHSTSNTHFTVFWLGFVLVLVPATVLAVRSARTLPTLLVLSLYGVITFVPKFLMSRNGPVYFDEFGHIRHANDIVASGHLGVASSYLPIIRVYPGLEVLTAWVHDITGLSTWRAGQIIVLVGHTALLLLVWAIARATGLSRGAAAIAAIVYSLNPSYMYFDTQYGYESLGLPLCFGATAMSLAATRARSNRAAAAWCVGAFGAAAACITTHHISALFTVLLLSMVAFAPPGLVRRSVPSVSLWGPAVVALATAVAFGAWLSFVAPGTADYIGPHVRGGLRGVVELVTGVTPVGHASARHQLFAGSAAPAYEKLFAYLAPVLAGIAALAALLQAWSARRERARVALFAPFLVLAAVYFLSLPLALTVDGGETAHRAWAFGYLGIAVCAGFSAPIWRRAWLGRRTSVRALSIPGLAALVVLAIGNVAAGENVYYRFPGPYQFGTDTRSQTAELHDLAAWVRGNLPADSNVVTDRFTGEVITSETRLNVPSPSQSRAFGLYLEGDSASPSLRTFLADEHFTYWILDTRIETQQPAGKLFQGYLGPASINVDALELAGHADFLTPLYSTGHYLVMRISP